MTGIYEYEQGPREKGAAARRKLNHTYDSSGFDWILNCMDTK